MANQKINEIFDIQAIQQQVTEVKKQIESVLSEVELFSKKVQGSMKDIGNISSYKDLVNISEKLNKAQQEYETTLGNLKKLQQEEVQLKNKINQAYQHEFSRLEQVRKEVEQEAEAIIKKTKAQDNDLAQVKKSINQKQEEIRYTRESASANKLKSDSYVEMAKQASTVIGTINQNIARLNQEQIALKAVKDELNILNKVQENGQRLTEKQKQHRLELINAEFQHKQAISELSQAIKNEIKLDQSADSSITGMTAALGKMRLAYRNLTKEERESPFGKNLLTQIKDTDSNLKKLNASIGNHQGNVGNYSSAWDGLKGRLLAVTGVLAGAKTALSIVSSVLKSTQASGDAFNFELKALEASWDVFKKSMATADFSLFVRNAQDAAQAGKELASVLDQTFEIENSIRLRRAKDAEQLAVLREKLDDVNLSSKERAEAGEKYKSMVKGYYDEEIDKIQEVADATLKAFAAQVKGENESTDAAAENIKTFIEQYNLNKDLIKQANEYIKAQNSLNSILNQNKNSAALSLSKVARTSQDYVDYSKETKKLEQAIDNTSETVKKYSLLVRQYNLSNDEQIKSIVESHEKLYNAQAAYYNENRRITRSINTAKKESKNETKADEEASLIRLKSLQDYYNYIYTNERKSYEERSEALHAFNSGQIELIKRQGKAELLASNLTEKQKILIQEKTQNEIEKVRREGGDRILYFEEQHASILNKLNESNLQAQINSYRRTYADDNESFGNRINALENFGLKQKELIKSQKNFELKTLIEGSAEAEIVEKESARKIIELEESIKKERERIQLNEVAIRMQKSKDVKSEMDMQYNQELKSLTDRYRKGAITQTQYESKRSVLSIEYNKKIYENEINTLEEIIKNSGLKGKELENLERTLSEKKYEYAKWCNDQIIKSDEELVEKRKDLTSEAYASVFSIMNSIFEKNIQNLDAEKAKIDEVKQAQLDSLEEMNISEEEREARKEVIEEKAEKQKQRLENQKKKEQRKQAIAEKANSLIQVAINTALGVSKAWSNPFAAPALVPIILATGAIQAATIAAQPIPQYAKGTEDHPGGLAVVGDGGKKELIKTPSGEYYVTPSMPTIVDLPSHTEILPDFAKVFSNITQIPKFDYGLNELGQYDYKRIERKFDELARRIEEASARNRTQLNIELNKDGVWTSYELTKGRIIYMNQRLNLRR